MRTSRAARTATGGSRSMPCIPQRRRAPRRRPMAVRITTIVRRAPSDPRRADDPSGRGGSGDPPVRWDPPGRRRRRGGSPDPPVPTADRAGDGGGWRTSGMTVTRANVGDAGCRAVTPSTDGRASHEVRARCASGPTPRDQPQRAGRARGPAPTAPLRMRTRWIGGDQARPDPHPGRAGCAQAQAA